jgi:hypothetical protein
MEVHKSLCGVICCPLAKFPLHFTHIHRSSPAAELPLLWKFPKAKGPSPLGGSFTPLLHRVRGFPTLRLLCPIRLLVKSLEFRWALAYLLPTLLVILHEVSRARHVGLKQDDLGGAFLRVPSTLCGFPALHGVGQVYPCPLFIVICENYQRAYFPDSHWISVGRLTS